MSRVPRAGEAGSTEDRFARALRAAGPRLRAAALRLTSGRAAEADGLVREVVEHGLRARARCPAGGDVAAWAVAILYRRFLEGRDLLLDSGEAPPETYQAPWAAVTGAAVRGALERLDEVEREVFVRFERDRRSYEAIAAELGIPKDTVGPHLLAARRRLRELLVGGTETR